MALVHNTNSIVTQNLVLCLDAANIKSYPGSGTTWSDLSGNGNTGTLTGSPTYNSGYGTVKGTGTRTDANASSLVLAIPMDGVNNGTTFTDESANIKGSGSAKIITRSGAITSTTQSKFYGSSGYFDGSTSKLSTTGTSDFQFGTGNFTVEGWFYQTADNTYPAALEIGSHVGSTGILFMTRTSGSACIYSEGFYGTAATTLNTWNHIAWIRNNGRLLIFVNGILLSDVAFTNNLTNLTNGVTIGVVGSPGAAYYYPGYLQDFRIYKGLAKYTSNFIPSGSPNTTPTGAFPIYNTKDVLGFLTFNGSSQYASLSPSSGLNFGSSDFTISWWENPSLTQSAAIRKFGNIPNRGWTVNDWVIGQSGPTNFQFYVYNYNSASPMFTTTIVANIWQNIIVTRSGNTWSLFINAVSPISSINSSVSLDGNTSRSFYIGTSGTLTEFWKGNISHVSIHNRALSAAEVLQNYNALKSRYGLT